MDRDVERASCDADFWGDVIARSGEDEPLIHGFVHQPEKGLECQNTGGAEVAELGKTCRLFHSSTHPGS